RAPARSSDPSDPTDPIPTDTDPPRQSPGATLRPRPYFSPIAKKSKSPQALSEGSDPEARPEARPETKTQTTSRSLPSAPRRRRNPAETASRRARLVGH